MPSTINGIGTHYYGKKNRVVRTAVCGSCQRFGPLESYDTRLWFVVIFIPLIPLGRKRVIDQCSFCSRHVVADAHAFETARQLQTSEALEHYRREPSVENALIAHAQLLTFHEHDQAAEHRRAALERFPEHAELRSVMASQLLQVNAFDESATLFDEALARQPDLPEARIGVALRKMAEGEPDEARRLLRFLEEPGAGQRYRLGPLDSLAGCYQDQGRHEEALDLTEILLRELPELGQQSEFRAFVRKSERASGRIESILPPVNHSLGGFFRSKNSAYPAWQRRLVQGGLALGLVAGGLLINNAYIRGHRTLHVVNATGVPVEVRVDDEPPTMVPPGLDRLTVSEGKHRVRLGGPVAQTLDVKLESGYFDRWFQKPLWVLDPGGEAVLRELTVYYAENPRPTEDRLIVGQPFLALSHVDYPFEPPPDSIEVKNRKSQVVKTAVEWVQGQDEEALLTLAAEDREAALQFAERRLSRDPQREGLLTSYLRTAGVEGMPRVEAFLEKGLSRRPVSVAWHRMYQQAAEIDGQTPEELARRYDRMLADDPDNANLLYLRGRLETDPDRAREFFERAIAADPKIAWPRFALGMEAVAAARWDEALPQLTRARELGIDAELVEEPLHVTRLALGEAEDLIRAYRDRLRGESSRRENSRLSGRRAGGLGEGVGNRVGGGELVGSAPLRGRVGTGRAGACPRDVPGRRPGGQRARHRLIPSASIQPVPVPAASCPGRAAGNDRGRTVEDRRPGPLDRPGRQSRPDSGGPRRRGGPLARGRV